MDRDDSGPASTARVTSSLLIMLTKPCAPWPTPVLSPPCSQFSPNKALHTPMRGNLLAYCPTMDLIAVATGEERVYVYRLNGQRVLGLGNNRDVDLAVRGAEVEARRYESTANNWAGRSSAPRQILWDDAHAEDGSGQLLAVAWSDNAVRLINADSSKVVHQIDVAIGRDSTLSVLSWSVNFTNPREVRARIEGTEIALDDNLGAL